MARYSVDIHANVTGFEELDAIEKQIKNIQSIAKTPIDIKLDIDGSSDMKQLLNEIKNINKQTLTINTKSNIKNVNADIKSTSQAIGSVVEQTKKLDNFKFKLDTKGVEADLSKIKNRINKFSEETFSDTQKGYLKKIKDSYALLEIIKKDLGDKRQSGTLNANDIEKYNKQLKTTQNLMKILSDELSGMASNTDRLKLTSSMESWLKKNTNATKEAREQVRGYIEELNNAGSSLSKGKFNSISNSFKDVDSLMKAQGKLGKSWIQELGRGFKQIGQFAYTYGVIQDVVNQVGNSIRELKEVDTILTEISKTSDLTNTQLQQLGVSAFDSASKWGKSASDYLLGIQEMSRSGYYGKQAEQMAETSILAQAAGDLNADVANSYLLASNAAYQYQGNVEKLNALLDGQNMITNRNSVSMQDMAEATTEAASMASELGVQENQLSAIIGTIESRTKAGGNEVGNAIKSLLINVQNINNSKIASTFKKAGVAQTEFVNGVEQMRNPIEILEDLAEVFNTLEESDPLRTEILTNIGQKYQANKLSALLSGWSDYEKMLTDYSEGTGSAAVEAEKSANNWEGSLNKLSNAWTALIQNFANSDTITSAIQILTDLIKGVDDVTSSVGTISSVIGLITGGFAAKKGKGKYNIVVYDALSYKIA